MKRYDSGVVNYELRLILHKVERMRYCENRTYKQ